MIDLEFLARLIRTVDESGIDSVEIERGGTRVRIAKTPAATGANAVPSSGSAYAEAPQPAPAAAAASAEPATAAAPAPEQASNVVDITSPMVGTFYRAPSPDANPYVEVGQRVAKGDTLCIIEAMKLMNEMESEYDGVITAVLADNAEPVEYGQPLFQIEPA